MNKGVSKYSIFELKKISQQIRGKIVQMSHRARAPHLGSALSCVDVLAALYFNVLNIDKKKITSPDRDYFIMSKGHAIAALYATLNHKGIISDALLNQYCEPGSSLEEHPGPSSPAGVEAATGSLGHGLSFGSGIALSAKLNHLSNMVFVMVSDGECNEGSVWESAMVSAGRNLNNLCAVVDFNKWQATGRSQEVTALEPLSDKWKAFGWDAVEVDGHDMESLVTVLNKAKNKKNKPTAVITHTVKGKGVSFMEDDNNWHYRIPTGDEVKKALIELGQAHE